MIIYALLEFHCVSMSVAKLTLTIPDGKLKNFVNGQFSTADAYIDSENPATGEKIFELPDSSIAEVNAAVEAAKTAFPDWSKLPPAQRCKYMLKIADLIEENFETFAQAESQDQGKTLGFARTVDIPRAILNFRAFAVNTPMTLLVLFCIVTTVLIFSHLISLSISSSTPNTQHDIRDYVPEVIYHSPHRKLNFFIQLSWFISNLWGNFLMVILVTLVLWIKFAKYDTTNVTTTTQYLPPIIGTSILIPILIILLIVSFYIYATMHKHKLSTQKNNLTELENQVESLKITTKTINHHLGTV